MSVLVAGPPCGGKSRFAKESATSGQLVLDFDALMESSSRPGAESYVWTDR